MSTQLSMHLLWMRHPHTPFINGHVYYVTEDCWGNTLDMLHTDICWVICDNSYDVLAISLSDNTHPVCIERGSWFIHDGTQWIISATFGFVPVESSSNRSLDILGYDFFHHPQILSNNEYIGASHFQDSINFVQ